MAIIVKVYDDETEIGKMTAFLYDPVENIDADTVCQYAWIVEQDGKPPVKSDPGDLVEHVHGDGEWALIRRVIDKAGHGSEHG